MKDEYSRIHIITKHNALGRIEQETCYIVGSSRFVQVNRKDLFSCSKLDDNHIKIGPYKLRFVEYDWYGDLYHLEENFFDVVRIKWYFISRTLDLAYRRFIITLAVWNLAEYDFGRIPSLDDVYLVRKIKKLLGKEK